MSTESSYYTETVKLSKMDQQYHGRKADYRVREHGTDRILAKAATKEAAVAEAERKLAAEAAEMAAAERFERLADVPGPATVTGGDIERFDRAEYAADEEIREHDDIDDMDDYRPRLYTGATSEKLTSAQVAARRTARRSF